MARTGLSPVAGSPTEFDAYLGGEVTAGTAELLRVAFKDLLDNAAKFCPPH